jgi:TM2 domain-containing membrane protein YozV
MSLPRKYIFLFILSILSFSGKIIGQENVSSELRFINHMLGRQNYSEALFLLENLQTETTGQKDTVNYLIGWTLYGRKELKPSAYYLSLVSENSPWFEKSRFFAAYNHAYLGETKKSREFLGFFSEDSSDQVGLMKNFQLAGMALLERELDEFEYHAENFTGNFSITASEERKLNEYYHRISEMPTRSPFVAGIMSAAVPGLGRIYAGKTAEGISSFLYVGALFATSWDLYNRLGGNNPFFIISATISGIFYVGNIWGSAVAVNRVQREFNYEMDQRILLDMHIPLRKLFP